VENDKCIYHKEFLKIFCITCNYPLCVLCVDFDIEHKEHEKRTIARMLEEADEKKIEFK
jgi:hypothetical protein